MRCVVLYVRKVKGMIVWKTTAKWELLKLVYVRTEYVLWSCA